SARPLATTLAALHGVALAAALATLRHGQGSSRLCGRGGRVDCESVLSSPYAHVAGVPVAGVGVAGCGAALLVLATAAVAPAATALAAASLSFAAALPASLAFIVAQAGLRRICILCMAVHTSVILGAAAFGLGAGTG